jgi:hypothetical protein
VSSLVTLGPTPFSPVGGPQWWPRSWAALPSADSATPGAGNHRKDSLDQSVPATQGKHPACGPRTFELTRRQIAHGGMDRFSGPEEAK